ncbi:MAG TPA: DUF5985 family protein [Polyangiaceae bacterium]
MAELIYILCALTSTLCAGLLVANYRRTKLRLALLASLCFVGLAANNVLLFVDLVVAPETDLGFVRGAVALAAMLVLVLGLVLEET